MSKPSKSTRAIELGQDAVAELWHDPEGEPFADVRRGTVRETLPIASRAFRRWLAGIFYRAEGQALGGQSATDAVDVLVAQAVHMGIEREVHVRLASRDGAIYLDLGDEWWGAIQIDADGWRLDVEPPVRFRRPRGMRALPVPVPAAGEGWSALRELLHVEDEDTWVLIVAWLIGTLHPSGPYPVLALAGEQGTAKSTTGRILRSLVDPSEAMLRSPPREDRDLVVAARNSHIVAFDNLSSIREWLSDALCRIATGGGYSARQLYTDGEEVIYSDRRPILLTSIEDVATRGDLADRAIAVHLALMPERVRRTETEIEAVLARIRAQVLGDLLDAASTALRRRQEIQLDTLPRMADFAEWIVAAEPALPWNDGAFLRAYGTAREDMVRVSVEADLVATAIIALIEENNEFSGSASDLLDALDRRRNGVPTPKDWPTTPQALGGRLTRAAPLLRSSGCEVEKGEGRDRRTIYIRWHRNADPAHGAHPCARVRTSEGIASRENPHGSADVRDVRDVRDDCVPVPVDDEDAYYEDLVDEAMAKTTHGSA